MQDNRPAVYTEGDNKVIYRASALGHCLRMLWAARCGMDRRPYPETIQNAMDEGTELEPKILAMLEKDYGFQFTNSAQLQVELILGSWNGRTIIVRGKVDEATNTAPVDVKAFGQTLVDQFHTYGTFDRYDWQQSVYAIGYGSQFFYMPIYNKDTGKIEEWSLAPMAPRYSREQIRDRVLMVEEAYENNTMPEDCPAEYGCPYFYLHDSSKSIHEDIPTDLQPFVNARIALTEKINVFRKAQGILNDKLKEQLPTGTTFEHDGYTIVVFPNPAKLNTPAVKHLLTEMGVDWQHDPELWRKDKGMQVRMTPQKKVSDG